MGFCIPKIWQILKRFARNFHQAQTLKLGGVYVQHLLHIKSDIFKEYGFFFREISLQFLFLISRIVLKKNFF